MFELLLLIYVLPVCYSYRFADIGCTLAYSRNAAVGIMAGKENFRLDMELVTLAFVLVISGSLFRQHSDG